MVGSVCPLISIARVMLSPVWYILIESSFLNTDGTIGWTVNFATQDRSSFSLAINLMIFFIVIHTTL